MPPASPRSPKLWVYVPYVDDVPTGMQRYASQMILALRRAGIPFELLLGEVHANPGWLHGISYRSIFRSGLARRLPRSIVSFGRVAWLQIVFPLTLGRGRDTTLLGLAAEICPFPSFRQIGVAHDLTDFHPSSKRKGLAKWVKNALWRAGLRRSAATIAISNATKADMVDIFGLTPNQIHVVYEGFDRALFKPADHAGRNPGEPYLLYAGTLDPHKNIPFALRVYAGLRVAGHRIGFKLVGRQEPARVAALIDALPADLREGVQFIGFVPDETLAALMQRCAAFVFPSRNEGFGLAPVEAMACGAPVIAAAAGSLPEVIADGGVLLDPDDEETWVREIERVLADPDHRAQLSRSAVARAGTFSWDSAAVEFGAILDRSSPGEKASSRRTPARQARLGKVV